MYLKSVSIKFYSSFLNYITAVFSDKRPEKSDYKPGKISQGNIQLMIHEK